ncbi:ABC transporter substrate-binding protein [Tabrizicola sp.]|uniref:ABC transporter substrate-binding protein n=1 Tax=Tabrizicola sp. TaxID=2005166 RepID=UPI001A41763D|nr:ABC transporter substrate-binding protein [Tabrizicola sp.]MBL9061314.1 twin-arginine translocation signal domain-containing protein [Tabrizicola sp.]
MRDGNGWTSAGLLSRRGFLGTAAAGALVTAGGLWLPRAAHAQEAKKGGTLRLGMEGGTSTDSFNPMTLSDEVPISLCYAVMNGLIEFDGAGQPQPELIESWEVAPGAKVWTFNIRQGVTFSNGKTLDAQDVIYSINLHRGETVSQLKGNLEPITDIKKITDTQIEITLSQGNADFVALLGDYHLLVVPDGHTDWANPIGTGAYVVESFEPGVRAVFKNRGDYWKPGRGNFDTVEIRYIADAVARTSALQSGQIDGANRLDPRTVDFLMQAPNLHIVRGEGTGLRYVFCARVSDDPYTNKNAVLALKYGIDRQKIIDNVLNGYATIGNDHTVAPSNPFFNADLPQRAYDPDKAAFHLKEAGLTGSEFRLTVSEGAWVTSPDCAQIFQQSLEPAGIKLELNKVPADGYWSNVWRVDPFCAVIWGARMTADESLTVSYSTASPMNDSNWKNETFDKLLAEARVELDQAKRKEMYATCQQLVSDEAGHIVFAINDTLDGYATTVMGVDKHPRFGMCDLRVAEKAWFA